MIKLKKRSAGVPVTVEMELAGEKFDMEIIPKPRSEQAEVLAEFKKTKTVPNPKTGRMEVVVYYDSDKATNDKYEKKANDLLDEIVSNFHGVGNSEGELDGTKRDNKILLGSVLVEDVEEIQIEDESGEKAVIKQPRKRMFRQLIFDKSTELADVIAEAETKNSERLSPGSMETETDITPASAAR